MIWVSTAGVFVTLAGVIYVAMTLGATREAVSATNRATDETRKIGEAQARAYLSCPDGIFKVNPANHCDSEIAINIRNSGNSPARELSMKVKVVADYSADGMAIGLISIRLPKLLIHDIASHETHSPRAIISGLDQLSADCLLKGEADIGVFGAINFTDVFGVEESHRFALVGRRENNEIDSDGFAIIPLVRCHPDRWR
ncbi:MAG: hypothetical protein VX640_03485 [Pseudomonadota bacterium]|nr:hypothetical protein [Pseudomonadota bacterium]